MPVLINAWEGRITHGVPAKASEKDMGSDVLFMVGRWGFVNVFLG